MTETCNVTVGYDTEIRAASWSCQCGASEVIPHARPGMGEVVARRLAGIKADLHLRKEVPEAQDGGERTDV